MTMPFLVPLATMTRLRQRHAVCQLSRCFDSLCRLRPRVGPDAPGPAGESTTPGDFRLGSWSEAGALLPSTTSWLAMGGCSNSASRMSKWWAGYHPRPGVLIGRPKSTQVHPDPWRIRTSRVLRPDPSPLRLSVSPSWPSRTIANPVFYSASVTGPWSLVSRATPVLA